MKVILLKDVAKIGKKGEVAEVPDGYALNQLMPKKMAEPATSANLKRVEKLSATAVASADAAVAKFAAAKASLAAYKPVVTAEANEKGHLFKAVNAGDIAAAASKNGILLSEDMIKFTGPVKDLGEHTIQLTHGQDHAEFIIEVTQK